MSDDKINLQLAELETKELSVHVAASHERYRHLDDSLRRIEKEMDKNAEESKRQYNELKKIIIWTATSIFGAAVFPIIQNMFDIFK